MTPPHFPHPGPKGKILVIDDELDIREGLSDLLTLEGGYAVDLAHNGTEGLHKLEGFALGREIKRAGGRAASPIARAPLRSKVRLISGLRALPCDFRFPAACR